MSNDSTSAQHTLSEPFLAALGEFRVFRAPQATNEIAEPNLPDSYFTPTTADLKRAQDSLTARTQAIVNAPLRTQAMRDLELTNKLARYPTTTIRVRFSDRTQLEKVFSSTDKIRSVYAFVRSALSDSVKPIKFVLYQTPPKRELKVSDPKVRDLTLFQLNLAPSSILHLKFEDDSLNHAHVAAPLQELVLQRAEDCPRPPQADDAPKSQTAEEVPQTDSQLSARSKTAKVPKWLKLGNK